MSFSCSCRAVKVRQSAVELLAAYGLPDWSFSFNRRKTEVGLCLYGPRQIQLSLHFIELNDDDLVRDTLLHEIAHALVGPGHGHDAVWKRKCREVGARPERLCHEARMPEGRWRAVCGGCGTLHHRHRRPKHFRGWWCLYCGPQKGSLTWGRAG